jgi:ribulose 1,5-bisphosphate synthetase/thiazole synthase
MGLIPVLEVLYKPLSPKWINATRSRDSKGVNKVKKSSAKKVIQENLETKVCLQTDVIVVGGGPGGHSAAMAAARSGAKTVLLERYGHLGGMATGGIVIQIPHMSDGGKEPVIAGLTLEWLERLDK